MSKKAEKTVSRTYRVEELGVINNLDSISTLYVDGAQGYASSGNVVKFNLYDIIQEVIGDKKNIVLHKRMTTQLVMTKETAVNIATWLLQQSGAKVVEVDTVKDGTRD